MPEQDTMLIKLVFSFFISRLYDDDILDKQKNGTDREERGWAVSGREHGRKGWPVSGQGQCEDSQRSCLTLTWGNSRND
jgi:hypothetical protein